MRPAPLSSRGTALFAGALLTAAGCSFVSSPDDLTGSGGRGGTAGAAGADATAGKAGASGSATGGAGSGGSSAGTSGNPPAGSGGVGGTGGGNEGGASGASGGAGKSGASGVGGAGGAAGQPPGGGAGGTAGQGGASGSAGAAGQASVKTGAIVMGGVAGAGNEAKDVLVVLDPQTGKELSRENMVVAAVAHDAAVDENRWFIFESKGFAEPTPTDEIALHVRTLDVATGAWTPIVTLKVPSLVIGSVVVLNNRLAYLGYTAGTPAQRRLVVLDTTASMYGEIVVGGENAYATAGATGLVGIRSMGTPGGTLDVVGVTAAPCGGSGGAGGGGNTPGFCEVSLRPITVDAAGVTAFAAKKALSFPYSVGAQATWTASTANNEVYIAFPAKEGEQPFLRRFSPAGVTALGQAVPFDATGRTFRSMAFDECNGLAFLTELNADQAVFAIPAKKVAPAAVQSLGKPGQRVLYEPTTHSAIVPFSQGGTHSLRAFTVDAGASPPALTERSGASWTPPDIAPGPIAVRGLSACP